MFYTVQKARITVYCIDFENINWIVSGCKLFAIFFRMNQFYKITDFIRFRKFDKGKQFSFNNPIVIFNFSNKQWRIRIMEALFLFNGFAIEVCITILTAMKASVIFSNVNTLNATTFFSLVFIF